MRRSNTLATILALVLASGACVPDEVSYSVTTRAVSWDGGVLYKENGKSVPCTTEMKWGCCQGNIVGFCKNGFAHMGLCTGAGQCGWSSTLNHYACGTSGKPDPSGKHPMSCEQDAGGPPPPPEGGYPIPPEFAAPPMEGGYPAPPEFGAPEFGPPPPEFGPPPPPGDGRAPPTDGKPPPPPGDMPPPPPGDMPPPPPGDMSSPPPEKGAPGDWQGLPDKGAGTGDAWTSKKRDDDQGCSCSPVAPSPGGLWLLTLLALALRLRRR